MGMTFENLTWDDMCELMCGGIEDDGEEQFKECDKTNRRSKKGVTSSRKFFERFEKEHRVDRQQKQAERKSSI